MPIFYLFRDAIMSFSPIPFELPCSPPGFRESDFATGLFLLDVGLSDFEKF